MANPFEDVFINPLVHFTVLSRQPLETPPELRQDASLALLDSIIRTVAVSGLPPNTELNSRLWMVEVTSIVCSEQAERSLMCTVVS